MIFLRDPQIQVERSAEKLTISYRPSLGFRIVMLAGLFPLALSITGLATFGQFEQGLHREPAATIVVLLMYMAVGLLGLGGTYLLIASWLNRLVITADGDGVTANSSHWIPLVKTRRVVAAGIQQFFLNRVSASGGYCGDLSVLAEGNVAPLCSFMPSGIASFQIVKELNEFYRIPLRRAEGYNLSYDNAEPEDHNSDRIEVTSEQLGVERTDDELDLRVKLPPGAGRLFIVGGVVFAVYGLTPLGSWPDVRTSQIVAGFAVILVGLGLVAYGVWQRRRQLWFSASSEFVSVGSAYGGVLFPVKGDLGDLRCFVPIGQTRSQLFFVSSEGTATRLSSLFFDKAVAREVARRLNEFYCRPEEQIATYWTSLVDETVLPVTSKILQVVRTADSLSVTWPFPKSLGWLFVGLSALFPIFGFVFAQSGGYSDSVLFDYVFFAFLFLLCCGTGVYSLVTRVKISGSSDGIVVESNPRLPWLAPKQFKVQPTSLFEARHISSKGENSYIWLHDGNRANRLPYVWGDNRVVSASVALLNDFYQLSPAKAASVAQEAASTPTESFVGKSFKLDRTKHELVASYKGSTLMAIVAIVYGLVPAIFLVWVALRNYSVLPLLSIAALVLGLASFAVAVIGGLTSINRTEIMATRYEIVVSFGNYTWKKPTKLSPSQVKEWVSRGKPESVGESWQAAVGYSDATRTYVPLATQIPSWAAAEYLKSQLEIFYANQPKADASHATESES